MRENERNKRKYLIIGLCAVLVIMVVGYASFASNLTINTSSEISSNWNIEITNITPVISSGSGATDNSSSCDESGTPKQCGDKLTASVSANLVSPGDSIMYRIEVTNKGSLNALLSSINLVAGESNDIGYYVNKDKTNTTISESGYRLLEEDGVLNASGDSNNLDKGYVYLTIYYKEYEGQTSPTGANKTVSATAKFNFVQTNNSVSSGSSTSTKFTGPVYRATDALLGLGAIVTGNYYCNIELETGDNYGCFDTEALCLEAIEGYTETNTCELTALSMDDTLGFGVYSTSESEILNQRVIYLQNEVVDDKITESYACVKFPIIDEPVCLKGGGKDNTTGVSPYYGTSTTGNRGILESLKDIFISYGGSCSFDDNRSRCEYDEVVISATKYGNAKAEDIMGSHEEFLSYCEVNPNGISGCDSNL